MCHPPPRAIRGARMRENRSVHNCFFSVLPLCAASKLDPDPKHLASKKHDMTRHSMCFFQGSFFYQRNTLVFAFLPWVVFTIMVVCLLRSTGLPENFTQHKRASDCEHYCFAMCIIRRVFSNILSEESKCVCSPLGMFTVNT